MIPPVDGRLVDAQRGIVSRRIFADAQLHRDEQRRVFRRTWCLLGHTSSVPTPNSFVATSLGEDPVVVWRDGSGRVHAFLNTCPHRGNRLCLFDQGEAAVLTCSYHGWAFASDGRLAGVPFEDRAYVEPLDRDANALCEVPRVQEYGGFIFGCWDADAPSLESHLGELRWWLDTFLCFEDLGGLEALPGCQRYMTAGNWKLFCDNFVGDRYHTPVSHASAIKLGIARPSRGQGQHGYFMVHLRPAHGIGGFFTDTAQYEADLAQAKAHGPEVVEYVTERFRLLQERMGGVRDRPTHFSFGLGFPNLLLQGVGGAFRGNLIGICHPRGVDQSEVQQWVLVERQAPDVVKRAAARFVSRGQSAAGMIGPDDTENFERIVESMRAPMNDELSLHYGMAAGLEERWPGRDSWSVEGVPGFVGPEFWEVSQRRFYAHWAELMGLEA